MESELLLAATTVPVTPPPGHALGGYVARGSEIATGTHDPLEASVLWLGTAERPGVVWLCLDSIGVDTALAARLAAAIADPLGISQADVLVCASHTHCGPLGWTGSVHPAEPAEPEPPLIEALVAAVRSASRGLAGRRIPVGLSWCEAVIDGVGTNRHDPDGPHDRTAGVLLAHNGGEVAGVLLDYACHPTVLGPETLQWSADWPGAGRRVLASGLAAVSRGVPVVGFLQGAAGDVSPRFVRRRRDHHEVCRIGTVFAGDVLRSIALHASRIPAAVPRVSRTSITLPSRDRPSMSAVDRLISDAALADRALAGRPDAPQARIARTRLEGARAQRLLCEAKLPAAFELPVAAVTIGELAWVHVPVELYTSLGERIRARSPFPVTRVIGYTDGYFGYVADETAHAAGVYEALISVFDAAASDILVEGCARLLDTLSPG